MDDLDKKMEDKNTNDNIEDAKDTAKFEMPSSEDFDLKSKYEEELKKNRIEENSNTEFSDDKRMIFYIALLILVPVFIIFMSRFFSKTTIYLDDYASVNISGYNGYGVAKVSFNEDDFLEDYGENLKESMDKSSNVNVENFVDSYIDIDLSKTSNLSNGDSLEMDWNVKKEDIKKYFNINVNFSNKELIVDSLDEVKHFDPFENINISFEGLSGEASCVIEKEDSLEIYDDIDFIVENNGSFANGDIVNIKADFSYEGDDLEKYFLDKYGLLPERDRIEVTVTDLIKYIENYEELEGDSIDMLVKGGEDIFTSYVATEWSENRNLDAFEYMGNFFLTPKKYDSSIEYNNRIFLVYKVSESIKYKYFSEEGEDFCDYYWYVEFRNILVDADGSIKFDLENYSIPDNTFSKGVILVGPAYRKFEGYEDLDELKKNIIGESSEYDIIDNMIVIDEE